MGLKNISDIAENAVIDIDNVLELDAENKNYYNQRALYNVSLEEYDAALKDMESYAKLHDDDELPLGALDTRAFVYLMKGDNKKALEDYEAIFAKDVRIIPSLLGAGVIYINQGDVDEGKKLIEEALEKLTDEQRKYADPQLSILLQLAEEAMAAA